MSGTHHGGIVEDFELSIACGEEQFLATIRKCNLVRLNRLLVRAKLLQLSSIYGEQYIVL
jgi:hypothetical protein